MHYTFSVMNGIAIFMYIKMYGFELSTLISTLNENEKSYEKIQ